MLLKPQTGTKTIGTTGERVSATRIPVRSVTFIADPDNTASVFLGDADSQPLELTAGQAYSVGATDRGDYIDPYDFYVLGGAAGQLLNWLSVSNDFPER